MKIKLTSIKHFFQPVEVKIERICRKTNDIRTLKRLFKYHDVKVNELCYDGWYPLHIACISGLIDTVYFLLIEVDADPSIKSTVDNATPLHMACWSNHLDIVELLVENAGVDIEQRSKEGYTALHYAAWSGSTTIVKYLLDKKADLGARTNDDYTPLLLAARTGKYEIVKHLVEFTQVDIDETDSFGCSSLHHACWDGHLSVVAVLIKFGADILKADTHGRRPIDLSKTREIREVINSIAATGRKVRGVVSKRAPIRIRGASSTAASSETYSYIGKGASADADDSQLRSSADLYNSPFNHNSHSNESEVGASSTNDAPLNNGPNISSPEDKESAWDPEARLRHAAARLWELAGHASAGVLDGARIHTIDAQSVDHLSANEVAKIAAQNSSLSIPSLRDANSRTLFMYACESGKVKVARALSLLGSDALAVDAHGLNALHLACKEGNLEILDYLLSEFPRYNITCAVSSNGQTPAMLATIHNNLECLSELYDRGAGINLADSNGFTCLHFACLKNLKEIVVFLCMRAEADLQVVNVFGEMPYDLTALTPVKDLIAALLALRSFNISGAARARAKESVDNALKAIGGAAKKGAAPSSSSGSPSKGSPHTSSSRGKFKALLSTAMSVEKNEKVERYRKTVLRFQNVAKDALEQQSKQLGLHERPAPSPTLRVVEAEPAAHPLERLRNLMKQKRQHLQVKSADDYGSDTEDDTGGADDDLSYLSSSESGRSVSDDDIEDRRRAQRNARTSPTKSPSGGNAVLDRFEATVTDFERVVSMQSGSTVLEKAKSLLIMERDNKKHFSQATLTTSPIRAQQPSTPRVATGGAVGLVVANPSVSGATNLSNSDIEHNPRDILGTTMLRVLIAYSNSMYRSFYRWKHYNVRKRLYINSGGTSPNAPSGSKLKSIISNFGMQRKQLLVKGAATPETPLSVASVTGSPSSLASVPNSRNVNWDDMSPTTVNRAFEDEFATGIS